MQRSIRSTLFLAFSCLLGSSSESVAQLLQEYNPISSSAVAALTKIGTDTWAAGGTGVSEMGLPSAAFNNPAALRFGSLSVAAEFGYKAKARWTSDIDYDGMAIAPGVASVGMPVEDWNFSLSYANTYNQRLELAPIPITTTQFPEGTGEYFSYVRTVKIHSFAGSFSYTINDLLSVGATVGLSAIRLDESLYHTSARATGNGLLAVLGIAVCPNSSLSAGAVFKASPKVRMDVDYTTPSVIDPGGGNPPITFAVMTPDYVARFPWIIEVGASWDATSLIRIQSSVEYQHWSSLADAYSNPFQFHIGGIYNPFPTLSLRLGFFTQSDPWNSALSQNFLTGGIRFTVDWLALSVAVLDSHLFGNSSGSTFYGPDAEQFHQTIIQGGLVCTF